MDLDLLRLCHCPSPSLVVTPGCGFWPGCSTFPARRSLWPGWWQRDAPFCWWGAEIKLPPVALDAGFAGFAWVCPKSLSWCCCWMLWREQALKDAVPKRVFQSDGIKHFQVRLFNTSCHGGDSRRNLPKARAGKRCSPRVPAALPAGDGGAGGHWVPAQGTASRGCWQGPGAASMQNRPFPPFPAARSTSRKILPGLLPIPPGAGQEPAGHTPRRCPEGSTEPAQALGTLCPPRTPPGLPAPRGGDS